MPNYKHTKDLHLPTNSIIVWSKRTHTEVPVICGSCKNERWVSVPNVTVSKFTGLCHECSWKARRKHTDTEFLETGSVIYWNERQGPGRNEPIPVQCGICGEIRTIAASKIPKANFTGYCVDCARTGERSVLWKGGRFKHPNGYIQVRLTPDHKFFEMADSHNLVREHRLIMAEHIGRCLRNDEIVHHKNGVKDDNRIENLELLDRHLHHTGYNAPKQNSLEEELLAIIKNLLNTIIGGRKHKR